MRCRGPLAANPLPVDHARNEQADAATDSPPSCYDPWEMDEQLHHIQRVLDMENVSRADELDASTKAAYQRELARLDPRHPDWSSVQPPAADTAAHCATLQYRTTPAVWTWLTLCLGTAASLWGMVLLGWSVVAGGNDLWGVALAATFGGQAMLLAGLMLRQERLRPSGLAPKRDRVNRKLDELKDQLDRLAIEIGRE